MGHRFRQQPRTRVNGAVLIVALLVVALVATITAHAVSLQWRSIEVEEVERDRVQAAWILAGAVDWARLILREDARSGGADHLGEPWAIPLAEAKLASFLATVPDSTATDNAGFMSSVFLSGRILDLQSRLNVFNIAENGQVSEAWVRRFARLFEDLHLPAGELDAMVDTLKRASAPGTPGAPLIPQTVEDLIRCGLTRESVRRLEPFITVLPMRTHVNLNTATVEVIHAAVETISYSDAEQLVAARNNHPFLRVVDARTVVGGDEWSFPEGEVNVSSRFFEVQAKLRIDRVTVEEHTLVQRSGIDVKVLSRARVTPTT